MNNEQTDLIIDLLVHLSIQLDELAQLQYVTLTGKTDWEPRDYYTLTQKESTEP